jgi:hypothetical protein
MKRHLVVAALLVLAPPALGQLESPLLSKLRLNLVNPGGKSLAMGGAFVALADDATAALANPAGLTHLTAWQVGGSGKLFLFEPELQRALYALQPDGTYQEFLQEEDRPSGQQSDLEFASVVGPLGEHLSVAVYQAVNLRYRLDADDLAGGNYRAFAMAVPPNSAVTLDEQGGYDIRSEVWGLSLAANLGRLSLGAGVTFNRLRYDMTGSATGGGHLFITNADSIQGIPGAQPRLDTTVSAEVTSGTKAGWVAGFKWQVFEVGNVTLGGVYRKAPRFDVGYSITSVNAWNGARVSFSCGVDDPNVPGSGASACGSFDVPDDWSVGLSAQLHPNLLLSAEVQRIAYSQLQEGFVPVFAYCTVQASPCPAQNRVIPDGRSEDGTVPRAGAEWTIPSKGTFQVALRGGWHRQPANGMKVDLYPDADRDRRPDAGSVPAEIDQPPLTDAFRTTYDGGEDEDHVSFGLGMTVGRSLSVDLAAYLSTSNDAYVVSAFYRF